MLRYGFTVKHFYITKGLYNLIGNSGTKPEPSVTSVNGLTNDVILTTTNISQGDNLYFTNEKYTEIFKKQSSTELADAQTLLRKGVVLKLNGGKP